MQPNTGQKDALLQLLHTYYMQIAAIESKHNILAGDGDYRARIEQFHDAIRAYSAGTADPYAANSRLSVEYLAYDISFLREIQANPLAKSTHARPMSPGTQVATRRPEGSTQRRNPNTAIRHELMDLYKSYAVFFAALLSEQADMNYQARTDDKDMQVEEQAQLEQMVKEVGRGAINIRAMIEETIHDPELKKKLLAQLGSKRRKGVQSQEVLDILKASEEAIDKDIKDIEEAHFIFVTAQLGLYQQAKQLVQKLAREGLNVAGAFLQGAIGEAMGRGGGRGI